MQAIWKPEATIKRLKHRASLVNQIRQFFLERNVWEVDTPSISHSTITDVHVEVFQTHFITSSRPDTNPLYLVTSPEFHMKRLLAAGSGCIYQICKSFRNGESGRCHNPEFTMLEWYRVDFDHYDLMNEMDELLQLILKCNAAQRISYQQVFIDILDVCPLEDSIQKLKKVGKKLGFGDIANSEQDRDSLLQFLFRFGIEKKIGKQVPVFIYDFPASQAELARINLKDGRIAERFEVYFKGVELANGFHELSNPTQQLARFERKNALRTKLGLVTRAVDYNLIASLQAGLPDCAGVALGIDRLIMLSLNCNHINQVIAFPFLKA
ncbi:hypothetical protein CF67_14017 [Candidatus Photodesmus blepharus]|uniref:Aminoacyl-transfer RNA synthetases class-II family profile domain-containing protein n=1 Tax=Candidatus Photodesmus blepharonis TaxID=1179155 RepID=A0A084CP62_9GAMM|nr:elongation factor P--(R)-beta-lysine ligase [Candidatus Photodesmus blepharus]KEY91591.1 hypothetical protein CF67_14017 [Candidatus Photodesmus blepharus]